MKFRVKSPVVDAIQWNGTNTEEIVAFVGHVSAEVNTYGRLVLKGQNENVVVDMGPKDWVVRRENCNGLYTKENQDFVRNYVAM